MCEAQCIQCSLSQFTSISGTISVIAYAIATLLCFLNIRQRGESNYKVGMLLISLVGIAAHINVVYQLTNNEQGVHLSLFVVLGIVTLIMILFTHFALLLRQKPVINLYLAVFPIAMISILLILLMPFCQKPQPWSTGLSIHIFSSIIAYSLLTLCALQAIALAIQESALRKQYFKKLIHFLPPLQTMEELLFELLWLGMMILTLAIGSGFMFLDDMFAQHVAHKTILSLLAWCTFALLLWGHHQKGWRGKTAIRWTLSGFFILMLAYIGSQFVLEVMLQKS